MARKRKSRSKTNESLVPRESLPYWFDADVFRHWQRSDAQDSSAGNISNSETCSLGAKPEGQPKPAC